MRGNDDYIRQDDIMDPAAPEDGGYPGEFLGRWNWIPDFKELGVPDPVIDQLEKQHHYWWLVEELRNIGETAMPRAGYGLIAAALAEATEGHIVSFDWAFDEQHEGETAEEFLSWWGDKQIAHYGKKEFLQARPWK